MNDLIVHSLEKRVLSITQNLLQPKPMDLRLSGCVSLATIQFVAILLTILSNIFLFFAIQLKYKWTTNTKIYSINFIHISSIFKLNKIKWLKTDELLKIYTIYAVTIHNFI